MKVRRAVLVFAVLCSAAWLTGCADTSCDRGFEYAVDCDDCRPRPSACPRGIPGAANLVVRVSQPLPAEVRVYAGRAHESGTLVWSGAPTSATWSLRLPLGDYAATALYPGTGDTVLAVDGDVVGYTEERYCDGECYREADGTVDLRLR